MRIVHDIETPVQTSVQLNGGRITLCAFTDLPSNHPDLPPELFENEDEAIEIEGDPKFIKKMLVEWVQCLEDMEAFARENTECELRILASKQRKQRSAKRNKKPLTTPPSKGRSSITSSTRAGSGKG